MMIWNEECKVQPVLQPRHLSPIVDVPSFRGLYDYALLTRESIRVQTRDH